MSALLRLASKARFSLVPRSTLHVDHQSQPLHRLCHLRRAMGSLVFCLSRKEISAVGGLGLFRGREIQGRFSFARSLPRVQPCKAVKLLLIDRRWRLGAVARLTSSGTALVGLSTSTIWPFGSPASTALMFDAWRKRRTPLRYSWAAKGAKLLPRSSQRNSAKRRPGKPRERDGPSHRNSSFLR